MGLFAPWDRASFAVVQAAGLPCGAFVSGWDDPAALRQLADAWGIPLLALDDEDAIRPLTNPDWRPAFLAASGAGLYGLLERHTIAAPFHIAALYPAGGCSGATWPTSPAPAAPHGWQCQGTHTEIGLSVDRAALDDWFGGQTMQIQLDPADPLVQQLLGDIAGCWESVHAANGDPATALTPTNAALFSALTKLQQPVADPAALAAALAGDQAFVDALAGALLSRLDLVQRPQSTPPAT